MRKVLISLIITVLLLVLVSSSVMAGGVIKFGMGLPGELEIGTGMGIKLKNDTEMGFSMAGEFFFDLNENFSIGAGAEYQLKRNEKNGYDWFAFNFIPVYALGRYQIDSTFYVTGKMGYNLFQMEDPEPLELKGGLFFGIGGGAVLADTWQIEALYSINNGKIEEFDGTYKYSYSLEYSKIEVSVGYKF